MKKIIAMLLAVVMVLAMAACAPEAPKTEGTTTAPSTAPSTENTQPSSEATQPSTPADDPAVKGEGVMTYEQYAAAELQTEVTIEAYVQATQSWWDNKITVYTQDLDGAYFLYEMPCSEEDAAKLVPGTKIRVTGTKIAWEGEVEISDITSFEILPGEYIAYPEDVTDLLANEEELIKYQNMFVSFKNLTVVKIEYKNDEPGDDIYVTVAQGENEYSFCVERYLTGPETDVYKAFTDGIIKEGDTVMIEGFLYWYRGVNTHITGISNKVR